MSSPEVAAAQSSKPKRVRFNLSATETEDEVKRGGRNRRFMKKGAYRRKAKRLRKRNPDMFKNYSSFKFTKRETSLIERGQGFVPRPKNVNVTGLVADCKTLTRKCAWKWWWAEYGDELDQTEELDEEATDVFPKPKKFNLPKDPVPKSLTTFTSAVQSELVGTKPTNCAPNF